MLAGETRQTGRLGEHKPRQRQTATSCFPLNEKEFAVPLTRRAQNAFGGALIVGMIKVALSPPRFEFIVNN